MTGPEDDTLATTEITALDDPEGFVMLQFKPEALARHGLPVITYPMPVALLEIMLGNDGESPLPFMLAGLQIFTARGGCQWENFEPALLNLTENLAPDDRREEISAAGENWWIELGDIDPAAPAITIERDGKLIAAMTKREDGRLRATAFRSLDGKSANMLIGLSLRPHPVHGVSMRENNWEYALDCAAANGNNYAASRGEAYLGYYPDGIEARLLEMMRPALVALQLGVCFAFSE
ncbi:hypothetical protein [Erythrobacter sp.]|uniref:hypothetical protein n=1 Tax=Erythrobacter sp. TaxID=1042 RepID=UPI0025E11989|nr:hypothetical protein [Erythrobacter sp.]